MHVSTLGIKYVYAKKYINKKTKNKKTKISLKLSKGQPSNKEKINPSFLSSLTKNCYKANHKLGFYSQKLKLTSEKKTKIVIQIKLSVGK